MMQYQNKPKISPVNQTNNPNINQTTGLTVDQVNKHNNANDCWVIVQNHVYDVTNFLGQHPGGSDKIIPFCGKDATDAFLTKGGQGSHSPRAMQKLESLKIGLIK